MIRVFPNDRGSIPGRIILKTRKWYLIHPFLTLSIIRYGSIVSGRSRERSITLPYTLML